MAGRLGSRGPFGKIELMLLLVAIVWGGSYSAAKIATSQLPVLQFLVLRFGLTFLMLLPALRGLAVASWPTPLAGAPLLRPKLLIRQTLDLRSARFVVH